jgi:lysophospholipase L1-like esterase
MFRKLIILTLALLFIGSVSIPFVVAKNNNIIRAYGDSITLGVCANQSYVTIMAGQLGTTAKNYGVAGGMVPDLARSVYSANIKEDDVSTLMLGVNDEVFYGANANKMKAFRDGHAALIAWLAIPANKKKTARNRGINYSGNWSRTAIYGGIGKNMQGKGYANTTVYGKAILIASIRQNGNIAFLNISVDGICKGNLSIAPPDDVTSFKNITSTPYLIVVPDLSEGNHALSIHAFASSGERAYLDWIAGVAGNITVNAPGPRVYVGNIIRQKAANYAAKRGSYTNVVSYNKIIKRNVNLLASFGLNVRLVDVFAVIDPDEHLVSDGLHPNYSGQSILANAFIDVMNFK